jgi:cyclophilin family peptidyl-prolyl cis-trans isomerase
MKSKGLTLLLVLCFSLSCVGLAWAKNPTVVIKTSQGTIEAVLYKDKAPISVENFLKYVKDKAYDNTIFHRVMPNFMIQGGGMDKNLKERKSRAPIKNEAKNGLKNERGTLAMARTRDINSATNQFFINLKHNNFLDHGVRDYGYAVFGKVTKGLEVIDKIGALKTGSKGHFPANVPLTDVIIQSIRVK